MFFKVVYPDVPTPKEAESGSTRPFEISRYDELRESSNTRIANLEASPHKYHQ
jgi:hypothetical protein